MKDGRIEQTGSPLELYDHPANLFVAGFIGSPAMNFLPGTLRAAARRRPRRTGRRHAPAAPPANSAGSRRPGRDLRHPTPEHLAWQQRRQRHPDAGGDGRADRRRHLRRLPAPYTPRCRWCSANATTSRPAPPSACSPTCSAPTCSTPAAAAGPLSAFTAPTNAKGDTRWTLQPPPLSSKAPRPAALGATQPAGPGRARPVGAAYKPEGRQAARAALEPLRAGRHRPVHEERRRLHREDRRRGARRQRGWKTCGPRPRWPPTPAPARTSSCRPTTTQPLPREAARRDRPGRVPGQKYGGWYPAVEAYLKTRRQKAGSAWRLGAAGSCWCTAAATLKAAGFDRRPADTAGFLSCCGAEGKGHRPAWRWATPRATACGATG